jgi:hypothetical protein
LNQLSWASLQVNAVILLPVAPAVKSPFVIIHFRLLPSHFMPFLWPMTFKFLA